MISNGPTVVRTIVNSINSVMNCVAPFPCSILMGECLADCSPKGLESTNFSFDQQITPVPFDILTQMIQKKSSQCSLCWRRGGGLPVSSGSMLSGDASTVRQESVPQYWSMHRWCCLLWKAMQRSMFHYCILWYQYFKRYVHFSVMHLSHFYIYVTIRLSRTAIKTIINICVFIMNDQTELISFFCNA